MYFLSKFVSLLLRPKPLLGPAGTSNASKHSRRETFAVFEIHWVEEAVEELPTRGTLRDSDALLYNKTYLG